MAMGQNKTIFNAYQIVFFKTLELLIANCLYGFDYNPNVNCINTINKSLLQSYVFF